MADGGFQGIDLTSEVGQVTGIDWRVAHPIFVIILVGRDEIPFGIQKDLLCAKSPYYRQQIGTSQVGVELVVSLPNATTDAFGCFQNFIYTGKIYDKELSQEIPEYGLLLDVWKLATLMQMPPLRVAVLNAMADRRQATSGIPGTEMLIQAWRETDEGSGLRLMLISWAAEHMRANPEQRNHFAKSLPQYILSELVIVMSDLPAPISFTPRPVKHTIPVEVIDTDHPRPIINKRARKSAADVLITGPDTDLEAKPVLKKQARKSEPKGRPPNRRVSTVNNMFTPEEDPEWTTEKELEYCRGLIDRMIQGPGFWTRLVGPFKLPVNPLVDHVPNYFDVVKKPMDLTTIKNKITSGLYTNGPEFEADIRQIFQNCYEYWTREDGIWQTCETFEKYFNEQWSARNRWTSKTRIKAELFD